MPASHTDRFVTIANNQIQIRCQIYQGEQRYVDLTFAYDIDGILHVKAKDSGGNIKQAVMVNPLLSFGEKEIEDRLLLAKLERLYTELTGSDREYVAALHDEFQSVIQENSPI